MTAAKNVKVKLFWGLNMKIGIQWRGQKFGGGVYKREERLFLVVGERINKLLASAEVLFPSPNRQNPAIWSQFGPRLQNIISHDSLSGFFKFNHFSMMGHNRLTKVTIINFPQKIHQTNWSKNYATLYFVIHFSDIFNHCSIMMRSRKQTKLTSVHFSKKSRLRVNG